MSSFILKIIACICMFCDHIGYLIYNGKLSFFNFIGRLAFPIFAFQISEGYIHTKNLKKYVFRLSIFALLSQIPFMLFHSLISSGFALNIFFTLLLGLTCIIVYDKIQQYTIHLRTNNAHRFIIIMLTFIICIFIAYIAEIIHCDYGFFGVTIILLFYIFKNNKILMNISFILCTIIKYGINIARYGNFSIYCLLCICTILPIVFINLYNKKQGNKIKYFLYIFYPAHLLIIYFLWNVLYI